jgi:hypothetical protein
MWLSIVKAALLFVIGALCAVVFVRIKWDKDEEREKP